MLKNPTPNLEPFRTNADYINLAKLFYAAAGILLPHEPFFQKDFAEQCSTHGLPPYASELSYVLNNPDTYTDQLLIYQYQSELRFAEDSERPILDILIAVVKAFRHTVTPAHHIY
ncbi:hypothetical protein [Spirosoma endbachense]|uniref:Uncharacterized protein n=1 Tax=Spirosoma endbachense TaxID=2666025 RepID=A0A6P1W2W7_9BACT|nr:hypothetical protein [Spirosoma endbachense]QHV99234.1 hypothetical protein GJR95_31345 [Spirosoma endbachense]